MKYIKGNLFDYALQIKDDDIIIPHVVNIHGGWGAGFVLAINKYIGEYHMNNYQNYVRENRIAHKSPDKFDIVDYKLGGSVLYTTTDKNNNITIANMFAQTLGVDRPLNYEWLYTCMEDVALDLGYTESRIMAPKFGSALAGGEWSIIESMIKHLWKDFDVTIFEL